MYACMYSCCSINRVALYLLFIAVVNLLIKSITVYPITRHRGLHKLPQAHKKCAMKMKHTKKKPHACNFIDGRREFIGQAWKTRAMDINDLQVDDC